MLARTAYFLVALALAGTLIGCAAPANDRTAEPDPAPTDSPAAGMRLAPGLYDLADGTVQVLGTLEHRDLEGGFWVITGGTESEGNVGTQLAVIANGADFAEELKALEGKQVNAVGTRFEGVSIRMAGPEIEITEIDEVSDTIDPAE